MNQTSWWLLVVVIASVLGSYVYMKPVYDWDMLAYSALQYRRQGLNDEHFHEKIYNELLTQLDSSTQAFLTTEEFDSQCKSSSQFFSEQLPFYSIKPLYNDLIFLLVKVGLDPLQAMRLLSACGYALLIICVFTFLASRIHQGVALLFTILISVLPIAMLSARLLTPDILSTSFILLACVIYLLKERYHLSMVLLLLSIGLRPDNVAIAFVAAFAFSIHRSNPKIKLLIPIVYAIFSLLIYFGIGFLFEGYGWKITFQHSIIDLAKPVDDWRNIPLTASEYLKYLLLSVKKYQLVILPAVFITMLAFATVKVLIVRKVFDRKLTAVATVLSTSMVIKYIAFPRFDVRYYVAQYVFALMIIVLAVLSRQKSTKAS